VIAWIRRRRRGEVLVIVALLLVAGTWVLASARDVVPAGESGEFGLPCPM